MSLLRRPKYLLFLLSALFLLVACMVWLLFIPSFEPPAEKIVTVKRGWSLRKTSAMLEQEGIIKNKEFFIAMAMLLGKKGEVKAGEYVFHTKMRPLEVLKILVQGQVKQHLVTIPEGLTLFQIGQLLEDLSIVEKNAFLQKTSSPDLIASLNLPFFHSKKTIEFLRNRNGPMLEGFLFPNTYHFIKEMEPEEVIRIMVNQFIKIFNQDFIEKASHFGLTPMEVVILASIIEKESSLPDEKPIISAVFHNRLKKKMPLQSDPTVIYGISPFDGNLTKEHLLNPTPYNTYLYVGLPPTPICNPGRDSIWAALHPASVPYLYFVSKNDGSHHFSTELEEHQRAVARYQKSLLLQKGLEKK